MFIPCYQNQILVRLGNGKIVSLDVWKSETICDVIQKVHSEESNADDVYAVLDGRRLEGHMTLSDCKIEETAVITMKYRMYGGMQVLNRDPGVYYTSLINAHAGKCFYRSIKQKFYPECPIMAK